MKILANKDIRNLFLAVSVIWGSIPPAGTGRFLWLRYQRLSLCLLFTFFVGSGGYMGGLLLLFQKAE